MKNLKLIVIIGLLSLMSLSGCSFIDKTSKSQNNTNNINSGQSYIENKETKEKLWEIKIEKEQLSGYKYKFLLDSKLIEEVNIYDKSKKESIDSIELTDSENKFVFIMSLAEKNLENWENLFDFEIIAKDWETLKKEVIIEINKNWF